MHTNYGTLEPVPPNEQAVAEAHDWAGMDVADWIEPMLAGGWKLFKFIPNGKEPAEETEMWALDACLLLIHQMTVLEICMVASGEPGMYAMSMCLPTGLL